MEVGSQDRAISLWSRVLSKTRRRRFGTCPDSFEHSGTHGYSWTIVAIETCVLLIPMTVCGVLALRFGCERSDALPILSSTMTIYESVRGLPVPAKRPFAGDCHDTNAANLSSFVAKTELF